MERDGRGGLRRRVSTTGGTDFNCVITHALGHRDVFIVTDGEAGLDPALRAKAIRRRTQVHLIILSEETEHMRRHLDREFAGLVPPSCGSAWVGTEILHGGGGRHGVVPTPSASRQPASPEADDGIPF